MTMVEVVMVAAVVLVMGFLVAMLWISQGNVRLWQGTAETWRSNARKWQETSKQWQQLAESRKANR